MWKLVVLCLPVATEIALRAKRLAAVQNNTRVSVVNLLIMLPEQKDVSTSGPFLSQEVRSPARVD